MKKRTYTEAIERLTAIVETIEQDSPDVDMLMKLTDEAVQIITECKETLKTTDKRIEELLAQLHQED
ncbi:MAG: exodeoxyribonuclease VII small subunit [Bacteroidales bacterium]|nr:exodeoxyribonuclease VII small subunit [Porphyromonas sp.]MDD6934240.1 exodeoxyribonuclease VII small subunit [Bacteroidales bacterium]MDY3103049.1 exodeoxyribonuclease VII small subunit [Porphyromonas sp.]